MSTWLNDILNRVILKKCRRILTRVMGHGSLAWNVVYRSQLFFLYPINWILFKLRKKIKYENSVLHISYMIHTTYYTTRILRKFGMKADYLAVSEVNQFWNKSDFQAPVSMWPHIQALKEVIFFWRVVAKYEIIHSHSMSMLSTIGWELPFLRKMGRKVVIHYRGCEIRDRERNMFLHPESNICQKCNYNPYLCKKEIYKKKRQLSKKYGNLSLVTTPDMKDFVFEAEYFPFFVPEINLEDRPKMINRNNGEVKIVHVTVHPGIEGTDEIERAINNLRNKGHKINFVFLSFVPHDRVLEELRDADLTIGKMKMGYYANFQIESMVLGVPAITHIRPKFMTEELKNSGFIFSTLKDLEQTLQYYLTHPEKLEKKRKVARNSILFLHNNELLGRRLIELYAKIKSS